jgi:hypothetical protein
MQTTTSQPSDAISFKRNCSKCAHFNVCTIIRAVAPLLGNWAEGHEPFKPSDLAAICLEFLTVETTESQNL